jgi:putative ABC transport system substrate-binding protein
MVAAFGRGLGELGYVDGWNVTIKYRWAEGHYDRLPALALELVDGKVDLIARHSSGLGGEKRDLDDPNRLQRQRPG